MMLFASVISKSNLFETGDITSKLKKSARV